MRAEATGYTIHIKKDEMFSLIFAIKRGLVAAHVVEHCKLHAGMSTFYVNYQKDMDMLEMLCRAHGRPDVFVGIVSNLENLIGNGTKP